jgi:trehalose 6-phosphate phosphatase
MADTRPVCALSVMSEIRREIHGRRTGFFLDLDGTLAPIVSRPDLVELPATTKDILGRLIKDHLVCFVSGRALGDLQGRIGLTSAFYAANHGRQIAGPPESGLVLEVGVEHSEELEAAAAALQSSLLRVDGALVEMKGLSISVHYRLVSGPERPLVDRLVRDVARSFPSLHLTRGKMVYELGSTGTWNKGRAITWLLERLGWDPQHGCPVCLGDDLTDEDMFAAVQSWGVNVLVGLPDRPTRARYWLRDSDETALFLETFVTGGE